MGMQSESKIKEKYNEASVRFHQANRETVLASKAGEIDAQLDAMARSEIEWSYMMRLEFQNPWLAE